MIFLFNLPIDNAIIDLLGFGSTTIFSTIDLIGLCVFRAMLEAQTFQRSRKLDTDMSSCTKEISETSPVDLFSRKLYEEIYACGFSTEKIYESLDNVDSYEINSAARSLSLNPNRDGTLIIEMF